MYKIGEAADQSNYYSQISKIVQVKVGRMKTGKARICEKIRSDEFQHDLSPKHDVQAIPQGCPSRGNKELARLSASHAEKSKHTVTLAADSRFTSTKTLSCACVLGFASHLEQSIHGSCLGQNLQKGACSKHRHFLGVSSSQWCSTSHCQDNIGR